MDSGNVDFGRHMTMSPTKLFLFYFILLYLIYLDPFCLWATVIAGLSIIMNLKQ